MIKKCFIVFLFVFYLSSTTLVQAQTTCGEKVDCPAAVGECTSEGGPWPIGTLRTIPVEGVCRCSKSNESCSKKGDLCNVYLYPDDPSYADLIAEDKCECIKSSVLQTTFCDETWWTRCCTPGDAVDDGGGGTATPTSGGGTSSTSSISGSTQLDIDAAAAGSFCSQSTLSSLSLTGLNISLLNPASPTTIYPVVAQASNYTFNTSSSGGSYTVTLDLSGQTGATNYVCSCPAPLDPNNPYLCRYTGVASPSYNVNFYLKEYNLSNNSWFQVFGGNFFSRYNIASSVPATFCATDASCQAALSVPLSGSSNPNASGFAINNAANSGSIISSSSEGFTHSYLTLPDRINNLNSYAVSTDVNQLSYDYFYNLAKNDLHEFSNGEDYEPLLSDLTGNAWWSSTETNFIKINGNTNIDEAQGFQLTSGQSLVVFVDGNLTLDDSNPGDTNRKITSVANGGFLAFFVSGNILVTADVGYELDPTAPSVPAVSIANSNLEGIFVADGTLTIVSKTEIGEVPPDRKFIGAGTFVGWHNILLNRTFDDGNLGPILNNNQAIENFIYRPDFLANWPTKLKASLSNWREVDPQLINQE